MPNIITTDETKRLNISIYFRIIICIYSIFILINSNDNFEWYINFGAFIIYFTIFLFLHGKNGYLSYIRLIDDYIFIYIILYQYKELDIYSISLIFAPILNSQNYSGKKRSLLLYIFPIIIVCAILKSANYKILFPFFMFWIINYTAQKRVKLIQYYEKITSIIDDYFITNISLYYPHKIYKKCIPVFNDKPFEFGIKDIYCFRLYNGILTVASGSKFIWSHNINSDLVGEIISKTENERTFLIPSKKHIEINNKEITNNIAYTYKLDKNENEQIVYIFILSIEKYFFLYNIYDNKMALFLKPFFTKLSKVFESSLQQRSTEQKTIQDMRSKLNYVNAAIKSMHFIRNKLSPIKNYLSMIDDYNNSDIEKKKKINPFLEEEQKKIKSSLPLVLEQADFILEKSNNPFNIKSSIPHEIEDLVSLIRYIWTDYNLNNNFAINIENPKDAIAYDGIILNLILTNWISNIYKYNKGEYGIELTETTEVYQIAFHNSFDSEKPENTEFIKQFNSEDRLEINKRKSHGLYELKELTSQMSISNKLYIKNKLVFFELAFIKIKNCDEHLNI